MSLARVNGALALVLALATVTIVLTGRRRPKVTILSENYWRFLAAPWKLVTFAVAEAGMILVAPLTGDPTWDWLDAATMGALTYASAPFSVGTLYRCARRREPARHAIVALFAWLLSASWSYDFYILARDGFYPLSWSSNLVASSVLYAAAGLFWNLDWRERRGVVFAFMLDDWPSRGASTFGRIAVYATIAMLFVLAVLSPFLWSAWRDIVHR